MYFDIWTTLSGISLRGEIDFLIDLGSNEANVAG
jgi:hypothetical protein